MHLLNLSMLLQNQLFDNYSAKEIKMGEDRLRDLYITMTLCPKDKMKYSETQTIEHFCLSKFDYLRKELCSSNKEIQEQLENILGLQKPQTLIYAQCLNAITCMFISDSSFKPGQSKTQSSVRHIHSVNYHGVKPFLFNATNRKVL